MTTFEPRTSATALPTKPQPLPNRPLFLLKVLALMKDKLSSSNHSPVLKSTSLNWDGDLLLLQMGLPDAIQQFMVPLSWISDAKLCLIICRKDRIKV